MLQNLSIDKKIAYVNKKKEPDIQVLPKYPQKASAVSAVLFHKTTQ